MRRSLQDHGIGTSVDELANDFHEVIRLGCRIGAVDLPPPQAKKNRSDHPTWPFCLLEDRLQKGHRGGFSVGPSNGNAVDG